MTAMASITHVVISTGWVLVAAGIVIGQVLALSGRTSLVTLRRLLVGLTAQRWSRFVVFMGWMWVGWHFFAR